MASPPFSLHTLASGKVTERAAELSKVREHFERLGRTPYSTESEDYLFLYQSLFSCVRQDAQVWEKKPTPAVERRLEDASAVLRLVVERTIHQTERKPFTALRNHILQASVYRRQLVNPLALNYAKALDSALACRAHLEHLKPEEWVQLVFRCFDILLSKPIENETPLEEEFRDPEESMDVDGNESGATPGPAGPSTGRKRTHPESSSSSPNAHRSRRVQLLIPMTTVQREYASVLKRLFSTSRMHLLDKTICKEHRGDREPEGYEVMKRLQRGLLRSFSAFFSLFPGETSGTEDVLCAMNAALFDLELNAKDLVTEFGIDILPKLMDIWGIKNALAKEQLIISARLLLPFVSHSSVSSSVSHDLVARLFRRLDEDADVRGGLQPLTLDSLRLQLSDPGEAPPRPEEAPFRRTTFRNGHALTKEQAVTWSAMEVHAACLQKLHEHSEVSFAGKDGEREAKRQRREHPVKVFVASLEASQEPEHTRVFRLQSMLFFIDRAWTALHDELQTSIYDQLVKLVTDRSLSAQSWAIICLAAIAVQPSAAQMDWATLWSLVIRRLSTPSTSRAAAHLLHSILRSSLLESQRAITEIADFSKELSLQGPTFPYDSVCAFLCECLRIASRDATLYLMHIEDKVLTWLERTWKVVEGTAGNFGAHTKLEAHLSSDVLYLFAAICQLPSRTSLSTRILPPDCRTTQRLIDEHKYSVERDFLLHAKLPVPKLANEDATDDDIMINESSSNQTNGASAPSESPDELAYPSMQERSCTTFLQNALEHLLEEWSQLMDPASNATAEQLRRMADVAALSLSWEALLVLNGTRFTRKVIQLAASVLDAFASVLTKRAQRSSLKSENEVIPLLGLGHILGSSSSTETAAPELFLRPGIKSGIRRDVLAKISQDRERKPEKVDRQRVRLQGIIWRMADLQDAASSVMKALRGYLSREAEGRVDSANGSQDDGWGIAQHIAPQEAVARSDLMLARRATVEFCLIYITQVSTVINVNETRGHVEKILVGAVLSALINEPALLVPEQAFLFAARGDLRLSSEYTTMILQAITDASFEYSMIRDETFWTCALAFLHCSSSQCLQQESQVVETFLDFAVTAVRASRTYNFRGTPRLIAAWLHAYLEGDPSESKWTLEDERPRLVVEDLAVHGDFRVRFRHGPYMGAFFEQLPNDQNPMDYYDHLFDKLPAHIERFEEMLTRSVILGNIMLPSSEIRKAPYWALISTCLRYDQYTEHVQSIFLIVATLLGLDSLTDLFRPYAGQFAFSASHASSQGDGMDVYDLTKQPKLFGYPDRNSLATDCFQLMGPVFLAVSDDSDASGGFCFRALCNARNTVPQMGMQECLPRTIGLRIAFFMNTIPLDDISAVPTVKDIAVLIEGLVHHAQYCGLPPSSNAQFLESYLIEVVVTVLSLLLDTDFGGPDAAILQLFADLGEIAARFPGRHVSKLDSSSTRSSFRAFTMDIDKDFPMHRPILPAFSSLTILRCLLWLDAHYGKVFAEETVYHVVHELFDRATSAPMVNEQVRTLRAAILYISLCTTCFTRGSVLRTVLRGASALIGQVDVARTARNFLNWGLQIFLHLGQSDEILPEVLLSIGRALKRYELPTSDDSSSRFGQELEMWISLRMEGLYQNPELQDAVRTAIILWPSSCQTAFQFCQISLSNVEEVLMEEKGSTDKFLLVKFLSEASITAENSVSTLSKAGFWQLKAALHSVLDLDVQHCHALSDLIFTYSCQLEAVEMDTRPVPTELAIYLQEISALRRRSNDVPPSIYLVARLCQLLMDGSTEKRREAYVALRRTMTFVEGDVKTLSPLAQAEVSLIRSYPLSPYPSRERSLEELRDPAHVHLAEDYPNWVCFFALFFAELQAPYDPIWTQSTPLIKKHASFAQLVLAPLIHDILKREAALEPLENRTIRTAISDYFTKVLQQGRTTPASLQAILDVVIYLRNFEIDEARDPLSHDKWLCLDHRLLSSNAVRCRAYTTALMFHELAVDTPSKWQHVRDEEEILYSIYSHIDEPDGFYAIKARDTRTAVVRSAEHEGRWDLALGYYGSMARSNGSAPESDWASFGVIKSLQSLGFEQLAMSLLHSDHRRRASPEVVYDLAWRTDNWDLPVLPRDSTNSVAPLYTALRAVHRERRAEHVGAIINRCLIDSVQQLKGIPDDDMVSVLRSCINLVSLREILHWQSSAIQDWLRTQDSDSEDEQNFLGIPGDMDFQAAECLVATRVSLLRAVESRESREQIGDLASSFSRKLKGISRNCLLGLAKAARQAGNVQVALNAVTHAQQLDGSRPTLSTSSEFAHVLWSQGEKKPAIDALSQLVGEQLAVAGRGHRSEFLVLGRVAALQARLGWWMSQAGLEEGKNINDRYFLPAIHLLERATGSIGADHASVFYHYALFADEQYQTIGTRDLSRYELYIRRKEQELAWFEAQGYDAALRRVQEARVTKTKPKAADYNLVHKYRVHRDRAYTLLQRDEARYAELVNAGRLFLKKAMEMFSKVLRFSDDHDENAAVRLLARWFSHFKDDDVNEAISADLDMVPSHKFVFLVHQLSARMERTVALPKGQKNLQSLMLRICREHPFHSLYQVFSLGGFRRSKTGVSATADGSQQGRIDAAAFIHYTLSIDPHIGPRIKHVFDAAEAYLEWANYPMKAQKPEQNKKHAMPSRLRLLRLINYDIPVATAHTPVDKTKAYRDIITIQGYDPYFTVAGGNNCPKISICKGSDGHRYKQLFKGEGGDDLRQDAVMEQVFELVNHLLEHDLQTKRRRLQMRTYRVIPLASQAGMLEFVENTSPLGGWLQAGHAKYHKDEPSVSKIRERIPAPEAQVPPDRKYKHYQEVCKLIQPVMRHYFTERRKIPAAWFAMRLRYARSVAVTSIVGHILGLGDRHLSNILIDNHTGEVVHIDLGIAFEQGTLLPIPETVPFRLTRDIVDGLGSSGTDGVFQRCAEHVLRVLREESDHIKTILEVFRYDPLHSWTASPFQIAKAQAIELTPSSTAAPPSTAGSDLPTSTALSTRASEADVTEDLNMESDMAQENADRALKSVSDKLDKSLSVEYTVNRLINEAKDPWNLSQIYSGWLPWY